MKSISLGTAVLVALVITASNSLAELSFFNSTAIAINDNTAASPYPSAIVVPRVSGLIESVSVTLSNVSHTFPDDIGVLLVGPHGQSAVLMSNAGLGTDITNVTLTFSDWAAGFLSDSAAIVAGTFKPSAYGNPVFPAPAPNGPYATNLSAFYGVSPSGTWNLFVLDDAASDSGSIADGWRLNITTATNLPPVLDNVNVTPSLPENGLATLTGNISDPNTTDSFALSVNWGDTVTNQNVSLAAGATSFLLTHRYLDDGQKGSPSANYKIGMTVTDSAGASDDGFLNALFQDLLCRPLDPAQRSFYENQITSFGRNTVVSGLLTSQEYRGKKVQDYFQQFLHRAASPGDQNFIALSALNEREIVSFILAGAEYFQNRGSNNNGVWLEAVYYDLLGRLPSVAEKNAYLPLIVQNGRGSAADSVLASQEFRQLQIEAWFQRFLHRASDASALAFVTALSSQTWEQVLSQLLGSAEYYNGRSGGTDFAAVSITVTNVPPVLSNVLLPSPISEGGITSLSGQFSDPGTKDAFTLQVDWGDGSPVQTTSFTNGANFFNLAHLFSVPHTTNVVQLTLADDDTGIVTQTLNVVVNERAPQITSVKRQPGSVTRLDCLGVPVRIYTVQASTNLSNPANWINLGQATATATGTFTTYDMAPGNLAQRFYRLRSP